MADKPPTIPRIDAAIVPLDRVHFADLEAGASQFDNWLRTASGGYVTLERIKEVSAALPVAGNIIAAIDVCGDISTLIQGRNVQPRTEAERIERILDWANLAINLIGVMPIPPGTTAARMSLRPTLGLVRQAVRQGATDLATASVAVIAGHFTATLMGELKPFVEEAKAKLVQILSDAGQEAEKRMTQLADGLDALASGRLTDPSENLKAARQNVSRVSGSALLHDPTQTLDDLFGAVWEVYKAGAKTGVNVLVSLTPAEARATVRSLAADIRASIPDVRKRIQSLSSEDVGTVMYMLNILIRAIQVYEQKKHHVGATVDGNKANQAKRKEGGGQVTNISKEARPQKPGPGCICEFGQPPARVGRAIGLALGDESFAHTDFVLPGVVPIEWARTYRSNFGAHDVQGPLGPRWTTPYHVAFEASGDGFLYHDAEGRTITYSSLPLAQPHYDARESCVLTRERADRIRVVRGEMLTEIYERQGLRFRLARIEDRSGNAITLAWTDDLLVGIEAAGTRIVLNHDAAGRITQLAQCDASGATIRTLAHYRYDAAGDLVEAADEDGASWHYTYSYHLVTRYTDRTGRGMNLEWDGTHLDAKAVHEWADDGTFDTRLAWHERLRLTFVTDALGNTTQQYYDIDGYVYRIVYPGRTEEWFFRDAAKHVTRHVFADGTVESFTWDDAGHLTSHTQQDGRTAYYVYDRHGNLTGLQDPEGHRWERYYDSKGRVVEALDPLGRATKYEYDRAGLPIAITDPKGGKTKIVWRPDGQLASYTDCSGKTSTWKYDERGRLVEARNAAGEATRYGYEAGQIASVTRADGQRETFERDAEGRLLTHRDGLNRETRYLYTAAGLLSQRKNARGDTLEYAWNPLGQIMALRNENAREYRFGYDTFGRLTSETDFDQREMRYYRDSGSGLVINLLAGGVMQAFDYDAMGRLERRRGWRAQFTDRGHVYLAPQGEVQVDTESFQYDGFGRLLTAKNRQSWVRRFYDPVGNLSREHLDLSVYKEDYAFVWRHEYDEVDARIATTRPDGRRVDWLTYGSGHVHGLMLDGRSIAHFERDDAHRETLRELGNGLKQATEYDQAGRLALQTLQGTSGKVMERRYEYDMAGQLVQIADMRRGEIQYAYDPIGRLTRAQSSLGVETFAFDPASNIVTATERDEHGIGVLGGKQATLLLDNLLKEYTGTHYVYDERGNLTERKRNGEHTTFGWNTFDRLVTASDHRMKATYVYDALGRRIVKLTEPQVSLLAAVGAGSGWLDAERQRLKQAHGYGVTLYGWDGDTLAYETSWEKRETTHYVYEPGSFTPLVLAVGPAVLREGVSGTPDLTSIAYYHCDQIGTPQEVTDEAGEVAWSARYKAWGEAKEVISDAARKAGITNPLRFAGQYFDRETGLHYNRHRYYDPSSGRFVSKDPIGLAGGINPYNYGKNPIGWVDPLGLTSTTPSTITAADITNKTRTEIRALAKSKDLVLAKSDATGSPIKWKCPCTGKERLRLDRGHTDPSTGLPYDDPKAAVDHVHAYDPTGKIKVVSPDDGNPHFPTTGE
ncbi:RHS repeat-associated core domain-containing protein [Burkholderia anthina]|uniref:RHS repeat-associated core domain-containing protein n=1 Tax=Burkholderia anthina TaxID=179879 RepID=UPI001AA0666C|nr:RHS repeat-associated core domain-containing protein [Burkholderia anthina]QTD89792.1 RHS repeat protein [Burkholderia anthina]